MNCNFRYSLLVVWIFLFFLPETSYSYYHLGNHTRESDFQYERSHARVAEGQVAFVAYDNLNCSSADTDQERLVYPRSDSFIPFDEISLHLPLYTSMREASVETSLANLLYANLELKRLLDKYESLHKQTTEMVQQSSTKEAYSPFILSKQKHMTSSIFQEWRSLTRQYNTNAKQAEPSDSLSKDQGPTSLAKAHYNETLRLSSPPIEYSDQIISQGKNALIIVRNQTINEAAKEGDTKTPLFDQSETDKKEKLRERKQSLRQFDSSLPWLVNFCLKINRYIMENKIEAAIYLFFFLLLSSILTSTKRK